MATAVGAREEVTLADDTDVVLKPLVIFELRKFMKIIDKFSGAKDEDEALNIGVEAAAFCLKEQRPEFWNEKKNNGTNEDGTAKPKGGHTEAFEKVADTDTVYKILEICGGIKLNDPNLLRAAMENTLGKD